ncbi:MAG: papain fold toxin domain-containing protein [Nostocaceae cyanobacterium]|nr:papain fold toxin domain-containing protein [Nostocaceae cyanobacterium]
MHIIEEINLDQLQQIQVIVSEFQNLECVECANAIKKYLLLQGISGKLIKIYTGAGTGRDSYIYDDNVPGDAISMNGRHQGISILIKNIEIVFDNHHPTGIPKSQWLENLQFYGKLYAGKNFQITESTF